MSTIVFAHGVPETAEIWNRVRFAISRQSFALRLPGFASAHELVPEERAALFQSMDVPLDDALELAGASDEAMGA